VLLPGFPFGRETELGYFRDSDKREVDFVIVENGRPALFQGVSGLCFLREFL
jgi:hypothetical protein